MVTKLTQTKPERGITPLHKFGILDSRNVYNVEERNAHLVFRAAEVYATLNVPEDKYEERQYRIAKRFYEEYKRILQIEGLSSDVCKACDRVISDLEIFVGVKG